MIIKRARYKSKMVEHKVRISDDVYGCDFCKKEIKEFPNESGRLEVTVFENNDGCESKHYHLCSWKCVLKFIPTIKSNYFATLPYLHFESDTTKGRAAKDLIKLI